MIISSPSEHIWPFKPHKLKVENIFVREPPPPPRQLHLLKARHNILFPKPQASGRQEENAGLKETQEIDIKPPQAKSKLGKLVNLTLMIIHKDNFKVFQRLLSFPETFSAGSFSGLLFLQRYYNLKCNILCFKTIKMISKVSPF